MKSVNLLALFGSDSAQSLFQHAAKSAVALLLNWLMLTQFSPGDYVRWSVTCSVIAVATASDLGIGQYAVTRLLHAERQRWAGIVARSILALLPLAAGSIFFVFFFVSGTTLQYRCAMAILLGLRILTIPFGAVLNAVNQFKVRKMIETGVYVLALTLIVVVSHEQSDVETALLVFNGAFLLGGVATVLAAGRYLRLSELARSWRWQGQLRDVYRESVPFMINNLAGLLTYGGFLWVSSFFLPQEEMMKLAILHTFVLMNLYQLYDVYLKSRQADLVEVAYTRRLQVSNQLVMAAVPIAMVIVGLDLWHLFLPNVSIGVVELLLFSMLIALELGSLFVQSLAQVNLAAAKWLGHYAFVKFGCQAMAFMLYMQFPVRADLASFMAWLVVCSAVAYFVIAWHFGLFNHGTQKTGEAG